MLRLIQQHRVRPVISLDRFWNFARAEGLSPRECPVQLPEPERPVRVPCTWESLPGLEDYRGQAWFWTEVDLPEGGVWQLRFGGVSHTANVFFDGQHLGEHYDAFTPFEFEVAGVEPGRHRVAVHVDNSFGPHSALHVENDYYTYGGITRPVELQRLPDCSIERLHACPKQGAGDWGLEVTLRLRNAGSAAAAAGQRVQVALPGLDAQTELELPAIALGMTETITTTFKALEAEAWDCGHPKLYTIQAHLLDGSGGAIDDWIDRIGFRECRVSGQDILLNGQPIRLRGFNRHEDHPQFGNALPPEAMLADLELIRDTGANCIRTSHYPNDARFLDLCDEMGFLVWEESHARQVDVTHPKFDQQIADSTREMIDHHYNHPSIILWGALNECASESEAGRPVYERVLGQIKTLDPSRPATYASHRHFNDLCLDLADVISFNMYPAWYEGDPSGVAAHLEKFLDFHERENRGDFRNKPLIISEFGAGGIYGNRQRCASKWSEEYQAQALDESLRVYLNHPRVAGALIWQFCDCRVTFHHWIARPRSMNNKGIVDEYRRPKLAYDNVKARLLE